MNSTPLWRLLLAAVGAFLAGAAGVVALIAATANVQQVPPLLASLVPVAFLLAFLVPAVAAGMAVLGGFSQARSFLDDVRRAFDAKSATLLGAITALLVCSPWVRANLGVVPAILLCLGGFIVGAGLMSRARRRAAVAIGGEPAPERRAPIARRNRFNVRPFQDSIEPLAPPPAKEEAVRLGHERTSPELAIPANVEVAVRILRDPAPSTKAPSRWLAPILLVLFVAVERSSRGWAAIVLLLAVLAFHELGHLLAMRAFGYRETRILFLPFLGALAAGKKASATARERALVLLAGPGPGIVLACLLLLAGHSALAHALGRYLAYVNAFNLLPLGFLDGGRFLQLLAAGRSASFEATVGRVLAALLAVVAWSIASIPLAVLAVFSFLGSGLDARIASAAIGLRPRWPEAPARIEDGTDAFFADAASELGTALPAFATTKPNVIAGHFRSLHERLTVSPLAATEKSALAGLYVVLLVAGAACALAPIR